MHHMNMIEPLPSETRLQRSYQQPGLPAHRMMPEAPRNNLLKLALRWWWVTPCCVVAALVMAKIYIIKTPRVYQSNSRIYVQQNRPRILEDNPFAVQQSATYLSNESELIQSTPVLSLVVDQLPPNVKRMAQPVNYVKGGLSVGISKNDDIMTVTFESTDPVEAADIANAVVKGYVAYQANQLQAMVTDVQGILEKEKTHCDEEVNAKLRALAQFKHDNVNLANEADQVAQLDQSLKTLSTSLTEAQVQEADAELNYNAALAVANDPKKLQDFVAGLRLNGDLPANAEADQARARLRQLAQQRADQVGRLGAQNPQIVDLDAAIAGIHPEAIEAEANVRDFKGHLARWATKLEIARSAVQRLKDQHDQQQAAATKLSMELADYKHTEADLEADVARAERLDEQADSKVKEINVGEDIGLAKVEVLEPARPSLDPVRPQKMNVLGIALAMGLMLGLSGVVACDWMDTRLRSPEQVLADLTVPVLGTVPRIPSGKNLIMSGRQVMLDPMSEVAEAFRSIRTALYFGMHDGRARTILVTSPMAGEGKTTLVSNLAISMAQAGRRVLILDADFRKPMQHTVFAMSAEIGLSSVLSGAATLEQAIRHSPIDRLDVLPCGPVPMNPSESLNSQGFQQLLTDLADEYDCVLLDSAPVVPVTDARILAAICDLTLLVLRAEQSTRKTSIYARNSLYSVGAEIAGIVLNDVSTWRGPGYATYQYRSRHISNGAAAEITADPVTPRMPELTRASQIAMATPPAATAKVKRNKKQG
jgi:capsular exopolysaccharide synthesis family protein